MDIAVLPNNQKQVNLIKYKDPFTGTINAGTGSLQFNPFVANITNHLTTDFVFNLGQYLTYETIEAGLYFFMFNIKTSIPVKIKLNLYERGDLTQTFTLSATADNEWQTIGQTFQLLDSVPIDFTFEVLANPDASSGSVQVELKDFMLELNSLNYKFKENQVVKGWESRVDVTNDVVTYPAETDTILNIVTGYENIGNFTGFLQTNKFQPNTPNGIAKIDIAFTLEVPSGSDNYIEIKAVVDGVVYRGFTYPIIKGSGNDYVSLSWEFPINNAIYLNGIEFIINPKVATGLKNRYIKASYESL